MTSSITKPPEGRATEQWLRENGFPTSVEKSVRQQRLPTRATPVFVGTVVLAVEVTLLATGWSFFAEWRNDAGFKHLLYLMIFPIAFIFPLAVTWFVGKSLRFAPRPVRPMLAIVAGAAAFAGLISIDLAAFSPGIAALAAVGTTIVAAVIAVVFSYWGVGSIPRWAAKQALRQVASVWAFVGKMIPMLVLTILFFLCAPEAWQLTAHMSRGRLWASAGLLGLAGVAFILVAAIDNVRHARQEGVASGDHLPLSVAERVNAVALVVIVQFTQAMLLAVMTFLFFTALATVLVPQDLITDWICPALAGASGDA